MRQSERDFLKRIIDSLAQTVSDQEEAFTAERAAWTEERKRLVDAILSGNTGEFLARQAAAKPKPIHDLPPEAHAPKPRAMGF